MNLGAIEAGGTKFVCAIGDEKGRVMESARFPTREPQETIEQVLDWFAARELPTAFGVGAFGPVELNSSSRNYGKILKTPKAGWEGVDLLKELKTRFARPVSIATDVEAAALAEWRMGNAQGRTCVVYLTVGTGIGGGILHDGQIFRGQFHSEMGHLAVAVPSAEVQHPSACPFHDDCWEGRASGTAMRMRWGRAGGELGAAHPAWDLEAAYLAGGIRSLCATIAPDAIVLGGGVSQQDGLLEKIQYQLLEQCGGYFPFLQSMADAQHLVKRALLGQNAGIVGCLLLAAQAT